MSKKPLALIFGFLGSKPRYLKKYAESLEKTNLFRSKDHFSNEFNTCSKDIDVMQYIASPTVLFKGDRGIKNTSTDIYNIIQDDIDRPLIFYLLSNNGAYTYANWLSFMKDNYPNQFLQLSNNTKALVWDSSPSFTSNEMFVRGFLSLFNTIINQPPSGDSKLAPIVRKLFQPILESSSRQELSNTLNNSLQNLVPNNIPQLFMLSKADNIIPIDTTLEYIQYHSQSNDSSHFKDCKVPDFLSNNTTSINNQYFYHDFVTSGHVQHIRENPELYQNILHSFIQYSLKTNENEVNIK